MFIKGQEEHSKLKVRRTERAPPYVDMTVWLKERLAGHGQPITGATVPVTIDVSMATGFAYASTHVIMSYCMGKNLRQTFGRYYRIKLCICWFVSLSYTDSYLTTGCYVCTVQAPRQKENVWQTVTTREWRNSRNTTPSVSSPAPDTAYALICYMDWCILIIILSMSEKVTIWKCRRTYNL